MCSVCGAGADAPVMGFGCQAAGVQSNGGSSGENSLASGLPVYTYEEIAQYLSSGYWGGGRGYDFATTTITFNIDALTANGQALALKALQAWQDVCDLAFVQTSGSANITFDDSFSGAFTSYTGIANGWNITSAFVNVHTSWGFGSYTYQTYIHEIGHALGLGHAGPYNGSASYATDAIYANDTWQFSVMSYFSQSAYGGATSRTVATPQMADIVAVQEKYGAADTRAGDTIYGFNTNAGSTYNFANYFSAPALTIYDSDGEDTLDCSQYSYSQVINLTPGSFSSIGGLVSNIGVYSTTIIENAIGGSGNDTIIGNSADNSLTGGAGNDTFHASAGDDTIDGGTGVRVEGASVASTLSHVEQLVFDNETINWMYDPGSNNGSFHDQILWRHRDGTTVLWLMNGSERAVDVNLSAIPTSWTIQATGDFDGDGKIDIVWRHNGGTTVLWRMDGGQKLLDIDLNSIPTSWRIHGIGDFDGDGKSDIVWRHDGGTTVLWRMNGGQKLLDVDLNSIPTQWHIQGIGDFNGDGKSDILWRHDGGTTVMWQMDSGTRLIDVDLNAIPLGWHVRGTGDFNGDGKSDILWRHDNGTTVLWLMNGGQKLGDINLNAIPSDWHVRSTGDFNGDGKSDILWRHDAGSTVLWLMDGSNRLSDTDLSNIANDWTIFQPNYDVV